MALYKFNRGGGGISLKQGKQCIEAYIYVSALSLLSYSTIENIPIKSMIASNAFHGFQGFNAPSQSNEKLFDKNYFSFHLSF